MMKIEKCKNIVQFSKDEGKPPKEALTNCLITMSGYKKLTPDVREEVGIAVQGWIRERGEPTYDKIEEWLSSLQEGIQNTAQRLFEKAMEQSMKEMNAEGGESPCLYKTLRIPYVLERAMQVIELHVPNAPTIEPVTLEREQYDLLSMMALVGMEAVGNELRKRREKEVTEKRQQQVAGGEEKEDDGDGD